MTFDHETAKGNISRTKIGLSAALLLVALLGGIVPSVIAAGGPNGDLGFLDTPASESHESSGYCDTPSAAGPDCKEICLLTMDGHVIPQGNFVCLPEDP